MEEDQHDGLHNYVPCKECVSDYLEAQPNLVRPELCAEPNHSLALENWGGFARLDSDWRPLCCLKTK